jgi:hypothetical protein
MLMHHAPDHGYGKTHHAIEHAGELQPADAAGGQCKVDGSPGVFDSETRIRPPLIHRHFESAARQQNGEQ